MTSVARQPGAVVPGTRRATVIAVADTDSYLKWGAAVLDGGDPEWDADLLVLRSPKLPSAHQVEQALAGSRFAGRQPQALRLTELVRVIAERAPDVVLVATQGPVARAVLHALDALPDRPVLVSGLPGISWPATRRAVEYRAQADLVLLHSHREIASFTEKAERRGVALRAGLLRLPFLRYVTPGDDPRDSVVFAVQSIVPRHRSERMLLLASLAEYARRHPEQRVVIKVRAVGAERQTHDEPFPYTELLAELADVPPNLVVADGPMAEHLRRALALVTVSSTAILEALAAGVPVHAVGDFGIGREQINEVFVGSGLIGDTDRLLAADFRPVDSDWARQNYLHPASDDDWGRQLAELVARRRTSGLPQRPRARPVVGGALRIAWERRRALGRDGSSPLGMVALAVGYPLYGAARLRSSIARRRRAARTPKEPA